MAKNEVVIKVKRGKEGFLIATLSRAFRITVRPYRQPDLKYKYFIVTSLHNRREVYDACLLSGVGPFDFSVS